MGYTIKELGKLAGVSTRTLRYYDEVNLLKPAYINSSGYRMYEEAEVDRLQQILFFKTLGFKLDVIKEQMNNDSFDEREALVCHLKALLEKRETLNQLIATVKKTLITKEGKGQMKDSEKFEGFKKAEIEKNEQSYGKEIRENYGDEVVDDSYKKFQGLSEEEYQKMNDLGEKIRFLLDEAISEGKVPDSSLGKEIAEMHKKWLSYTWNTYSKEAHQQMGEMYVADPRFKVYYDVNGEGRAAFLRDAINYYCKN